MRKLVDKTTGSIWIDLATKRRLEKMKKETVEWECKRCGKCCKFIVIPVMDPVNIETEGYLDAHGIAYDGKKLIIPAVCQYLKKGDLRGKDGEYYCTIHDDKFSNCRLGGEKECSEAKRAYALLYPSPQPSPSGGGRKGGGT